MDRSRIDSKTWKVRPPDPMVVDPSVAPEGYNTERVDKAWIVTFTGKQFYHLRPAADMICIEDIAHALSMICRWTGHTKWHYSVAQHSWHCSMLLDYDVELALEALLHDAAEAYLGDMNRPLKHYTDAGPAYQKVEAVVEEAISRKFGVRFPMPEIIKQADTQMLYAERDQIMNAGKIVTEPRKWGYDEIRATVTIEKWTPRHAEKMFLKRYAELIQRRAK